MFEYQYEASCSMRATGVSGWTYAGSANRISRTAITAIPLSPSTEGVFEAFDIENATLAGFSMGGGVATHYMSRHDEAHVDKLALLSAASPCLTEKPDFPEGLSDDDLKPFVEGTRNDRAAINAEFGELLFHTRPERRDIELALGPRNGGVGLRDGQVGHRSETDLRDELADSRRHEVYRAWDGVCRVRNHEAKYSTKTSRTLISFDSMNAVMGRSTRKRRILTDEILDIAG